MSDTQKPGRSVGRVLLRIVLALALALVVVVTTVVVLAGIFLFRGTEDQAPEVLFEISPGQSLRGVAGAMVSQGLARNAAFLEAYGRFSGLDARLQAGRYVVSASMSPAEILRKVAGGDAVFDEVVITIPEGWSLDDIERYMEEVGLFTVEEFQQAAVMQEAFRDFAFLAELEDDTILDGYLFPDTYRIFADSTPTTVVRRMLANFERRVLPQVSDELDAQDRNLHDLLTLASIVQAEAGNASEMPAVAGVFWNRLRDGIRLESDATVNYVLGTSKRQPTFADTEVDDPYNTYENFGLPPGPIGNPGLDAILASLQPARHDYYFFLHPLGQPIVLSRTFAEHLRNKARYLD